MHHHVAEMDADAQAEPPRMPLGLGERPLDSQGAGDGIRHAGELGEHAVPRRVGDPSVMCRDQMVDDLAGGLEGLHGAALVVMHRLRIAGDVGGEDRRRTTLRGRPFRCGGPVRPLAHGDSSAPQVTTARLPASAASSDNRARKDETSHEATSITSAIIENDLPFLPRTGLARNFPRIRDSESIRPMSTTRGGSTSVPIPDRDRCIGTAVPVAWCEYRKIASR